MGKLLDSINRILPANQRDPGYMIEVNELRILAETALTQLDKKYHAALNDIQTYYYRPLKTPGGPLSKPLQRFLNILCQYKNGLFEEIETFFKTRIMEEWEGMAAGVVKEGYSKESPSYRGVLFNEAMVPYKRELVYRYANDFLILRREEDAIANNPLSFEVNAAYSAIENAGFIAQRIADMAWKILLGSPISTFLEAGIAMDIDSDGTNRAALNTTHGARSMACDLTLAHLSKFEEIKHHPLVTQMNYCGKFLGKLGRMITVKACLESFARQGKEMFYAGLEAQCIEASILIPEAQTIRGDLQRNTTDWENMNQLVTGELCFPSLTPASRSPYLMRAQTQRGINSRQLLRSCIPKTCGY